MSTEPEPRGMAVGRKGTTKPSLWFHRLFLSAAIPDEAFMGSKALQQSLSPSCQGWGQVHSLSTPPHGKTSLPGGRVMNSRTQ